MLWILGGVFIILHGLVHLWMATLSLRLVEFKADMGWTGESWILSRPLPEFTVRTIAGAGFILAALLFVISGVGVLAQAEWSRAWLVVSAVFSGILLLLYWDGSFEMIVQKGLIGLLIDIAVLAVVLAGK